MRSMVVDEEDLRHRNAEPIPERVAHPELVAHPANHGVAEGSPGSRIGRERRHQDALELDEGLLVEDDVVEIVDTDARRLETEPDGALGIAGVVLLPGK